MSRKPFTGAAVAAAIGVGALAPQAADAAVPKNLRQEYLSLYKAAKKAGHNPGRNIVKLGVKTGKGKSAVRDAKIAEVRESLVVLRNMTGRATTSTPVGKGSAQGTQTRAVAAANGGGGGGGGLPHCTWGPESGGNYGAYNASSGAGGKYQIIPSTWAAYGGSPGGAASASPAEQEAVASRIYADVGGSAWVNC